MPEWFDTISSLMTRPSLLLESEQEVDATISAMVARQVMTLNNNWNDLFIECFIILIN